MADKAVLFAGQGAQTVGMGKALADSDADLMAYFARADEVLGYRLSAICFDGPEDALTKSNHCQPAIFVTSVVCWEALRKALPEMVVSGCAGLSLGEWTALYAAGVLDFDDALRALEARGRFMQEACEQEDGAMVSVIGLDETALQGVCERTGVQIANINSAEQIVLSGPRDGIEAAEAAAQQAGAKKTIVLNVAGAFHSRLMAPAAAKLAAFLETMPFAAPVLPVVSNVSGKPHEAPDAIRKAMVRQVTESVRWYPSMRWFLDNNVSTFVECGPGRVLSGLLKRIDRGATLTNIQDLSSLQGAVEVLNNS